LFAPDAARPHLLALYAFNVELSRIRETVTDPTIGEIRLQWWLDAIGGIFAGEAAGHPVLQALEPAIGRGGLPERSFRSMIEARRFDLFEDPMPTLNDLEGYLGETASALIQMAALVLDPENAAASANAAGFAGVAMGIAGQLRLLPITRARGQCYVPNDLLERERLTPAEIIRGEPSSGLEKVLSGLRAIARQRLEEARQHMGEISPAALPAFLPAALTELYLDRLAKLGPASLTRVADISPLRRQWRLYWSARRSLF
jgi:15-cis-phytoene synthase